MFKTVLFDDQIVLFWDKDARKNLIYKTFCNGALVCESDKTHSRINGLKPETAYNVKVEKHIGDVKEIFFESIICTTALKNKIDVTKPPYNAVGDGKTLNTLALQKAIDDCTGDDCVYLPDGTYLTGALMLHGDMELRLSDKAVIQGTTNVNDYLPKIKSRYDGIERVTHRSLLNLGDMDSKAGYVNKNIVIRGGTIFGGGLELCNNINETEKIVLKDEIEKVKNEIGEGNVTLWMPMRMRGRLINIYNTENILISDCNLGYSPAWNVQLVYSKEIIIHGCNLFSEGVPNGDGIDPDSSEDCYIFDCKFETGDDAIAVKSGKNLEGYTIGRPSKNIRIFDCSGRKGIALGSEMSGGLSDIKIWDCYFVSSRGGLRLRATPKRGGYIKDVLVQDSAFVDFHIYTAFGDQGNNDEGEKAPVMTEINGITLENVYLSGRSRKNLSTEFEPIEPIRIRGFKGEENYIKNVTIRNLTMPKAMRGIHVNEFENVKNLTIENWNFIE